MSRKGTACVIRRPVQSNSRCASHYPSGQDNPELNTLNSRTRWFSIPTEHRKFFPACQTAGAWSWSHKSK